MTVTAGAISDRPPSGPRPLENSRSLFLLAAQNKPQKGTEPAGSCPPAAAGSTNAGRLFFRIVSRVASIRRSFFGSISCRSLHASEKSRKDFDTIPEILEAKILIGGVLVVVVVRDRECNHREILVTLKKVHW